MKIYLLLFCIFLIAITDNAQTGTGPLLLGATSWGGAFNGGALISYAPDDTTVNTAYAFPVLTALPNITVTEASNGKVYGYLSTGGAHGWGYLYAYDPATHTTAALASFDSTTYYPASALLQLPDGLMYGTTNSCVYSYNISTNAITKLDTLPYETFTTGNEFIRAADGKLYVVLSYEGTSSGNGAIYQFDPVPGKGHVVYTFGEYSFNFNNGLLESGPDTLYGMNPSSYGGGAEIYRYITTADTLEVVHHILGSAEPQGTLIRASDGKFYGTTIYDGINENGTLFSYDLGSDAYSVIHYFTDTNVDGRVPVCDLYQASDGKLYGMTSLGGPSGYGVVFSYDISTSAYTILADLDSVRSEYPMQGHFIEYTPAATIHTQPAGRSTCANDTVMLTAAASGAGVREQWQVSYDGGTTFSNIAGATDSIYAASGFSSSTAIYRVVFSNNGPAIDTSAYAVITLYAPAQNTYTANICAGQNYVFHAHTYTLSGTYSDTLAAAAANGCDSVVTLHLTVTTINDSVIVNGPICTALQTGATYYIWINCLTHQHINGFDTQPTLHAPYDGSFECLIVTGSCTDTTNCVTVTGVGVNDLSAYRFTLYPNPTTGTFIMDNNYTGALTVEVINILGERMRTFPMNTAHAQFDISSLAAGMYEVHINDGGVMMKAFKVVKE